MVIGNYPALQNKDSTYIIEDENYISIFCCLTQKSVKTDHNSNGEIKSIR